MYDVTVLQVGCFAVLWPKIFYPMLFGGVIDVDKEEGKQSCSIDIFVNGVILNEQSSSKLRVFGTNHYRVDSYSIHLTMHF